MALCGKVRMSERTRSVALNALGAYGVKGASLLVSFFTLPAYIAYFGDQVALGVWYALLSIINWFNLFDFGIGNGLRNSLTRALATGDMQGGKTAVSSAYASAGIIAICVCAALLMAEGLVPWGELLRVDAAVVGEGVLVLSVRIVTVGIMARIVLGLATSVLYAMQRSALVNACSLVSSVMMLAYVALFRNHASAEEGLVILSVVHAVAINVPAIILTPIVFRELRSCLPSLRFVRLDVAKSVLSVGVKILWLTLAANVVFQMHPVFISAFVSPEAVVEYQAYFKVFNTCSSLLTLALVPVWSAVTKAQAEGCFRWVRKLHSLLVLAIAGVVVAMAVVAVMLQPLFDIWLGAEAFTVRPACVAVMVAYGAVCTLHGVNTTFENGLERLGLQMVLVSLAAAMTAPLSWWFANAMGDWIGVVMGSMLAILPYEVASPMVMGRHLRRCCDGVPVGTPLSEDEREVIE